MHALQVLETGEMEDSHEYCEGLVQTSTLGDTNESRLQVMNIHDLVPADAMNLGCNLFLRI